MASLPCQKRQQDSKPATELSETWSLFVLGCMIVVQCHHCKMAMNKRRKKKGLIPPKKKGRRAPKLA
jgi:hypothetical protein